jgi:hypothetical protein
MVADNDDRFRTVVSEVAALLSCMPVLWWRWTPSGCEKLIPSGFLRSTHAPAPTNTTTTTAATNSLRRRRRGGGPASSASSARSLVADGDVAPVIASPSRA